MLCMYDKTIDILCQRPTLTKDVQFGCDCFDDFDNFNCSVIGKTD